MKRMRRGKMPRAGDVVIAHVQFTDSREIKMRPAVVLFEEMGNIVVAGITSNLQMKGIPLLREEGAVKESVIKLNYIFTISKAMVSKTVFQLSKEKKYLVFKGLEKRLSELKRN
jgi:mRNA interferase MazF